MRSKLRWSRTLLLGVSLSLAVGSWADESGAQDLAGLVARARDLVDSGKYDDAARVLATLKNKTLPPQLAVEAALLETTALVVTQGADAATTACGRAVTASGFDPEVARDQSPKIREICRAAAKQVRGGRLSAEGASLGSLEVKAPEVAYQALRASTTLEQRPTWLKVALRVRSSEIEGTFDVPLIASQEGPLLGTLDAAWIRPGSKLTLALVAQDKFGDLGPPTGERVITVPEAEAAIALGAVPKGAKVELDGDPVVPDATGKVPATPGKHDISLTLEGGASAEASVELKRGVVTRVALTPQQQEPSRVLPWVATGTSFALLVAGGVLLINAEARRTELEDAAAKREPGTDLPATDYAELEAIDDERAIFQNVGIGLMAGGGGVAILATIFWLVPVGGSTSTASVRPLIGPGVLGVSGVY